MSRTAPRGRCTKQRLRRSQTASAPRHDRFDDPPTSDDKDEKDDKKDVDELEHTNPWAVPSGLPEPGGSSDTPRQPKADKKRD